MLFPRIYLTLVALFSLYLGVHATFFPVDFAVTTGYGPNNITGTTEIRAIWASQFGVAAFLLYAAFFKAEFIKPALIFFALYMMGFMMGRIVGMAVDGVEGNYHPGAFIGELVEIGLSLLGLKLLEKHESSLSTPDAQQ